MTEDVSKAVELTKKLYETNLAGGPIHIISDDGNLENDHIRWCWEYVKTWENAEERALVQDILKILAGMHYVDRYKYYCVLWGQDFGMEPFDVEGEGE